MKKLLFTLAIAFLFCSAAVAQNKSLTEFGVYIGLNSSTVESSGSSSAQPGSYTYGFNFGVSAEHYFSEGWSIKIKPTYDQKGWANGFLILNDGTEVDGIDFRLNYITLPVLASWHFGQTRNWYLNFGPYLGFLASTGESSNSGTDIKSAFNSVDGGLDFGIGVKIPLSNTANFFAEYDGQVGFANVFTQNTGGSFQNVRSSINIGLSFPLK